VPSEDAQELADVLDAVAGRVPALLRAVLDQLYSPEAGRRMGQAVGSFYQQLTEAGVPAERALQLTEDYASPLGLLRSVLGEAGRGRTVSWSWAGEGPGRAPAVRVREARRPRAEGPAPLEAWFNNAGVSHDRAPEAADLDGLGWSLSAEALAEAGVVPGGTVTVEGLTFSWPSAQPGQPDNVRAEGQEVRLPERPGARRLGLLGLATHGPSAGVATLRYADGSVEPVALCLPDWTLNGGQGAVPSWARVAVRMPRRNGRDGRDTDVETMVFAVTVPLQPGKTVESVTLPARVDQGELHVFAVALGD
jgi:hypothetical protein